MKSIAVLHASHLKFKCTGEICLHGCNSNNLNLTHTFLKVPTIAIMGSGGGYRAACGLSGVFVALQEEGILDCSTYVAGLSGFSW